MLITARNFSAASNKTEHEGSNGETRRHRRRRVSFLCGTFCNNGPVLRSHADKCQCERNESVRPQVPPLLWQFKGFFQNAPRRFAYRGRDSTKVFRTSEGIRTGLFALWPPQVKAEKRLEERTGKILALSWEIKHGCHLCISQAFQLKVRTGFALGTGPKISKTYKYNY